jgi:hypothetical protein
MPKLADPRIYDDHDKSPLVEKCSQQERQQGIAIAVTSRSQLDILISQQFTVPKQICGKHELQIELCSVRHENMMLQ